MSKMSQLHAELTEGEYDDLMTRHKKPISRMSLVPIGTTKQVVGHNEDYSRITLSMPRNAEFEQLAFN